nr:MAG TPA: hypothetical protein [Caudoviricetes sp.]
MSILAQGSAGMKKNVLNIRSRTIADLSLNQRWSCDPLHQDTIKLIKLCAVSSDRHTL